MAQCSEAATAEVYQVLYAYAFSSFTLTFEGDTVQLYGGHDKEDDYVIIRWTAPQPLEWIRLLAVGVHPDFVGSTSFRVYRNVGLC